MLGDGINVCFERYGFVWLCTGGGFMACITNEGLAWVLGMLHNNMVVSYNGWGPQNHRFQW